MGVTTLIVMQAPTRCVRFLLPRLPVCLSFGRLWCCQHCDGEMAFLRPASDVMVHCYTQSVIYAGRRGQKFYFCPMLTNQLSSILLEWRQVGTCGWDVKEQVNVSNAACVTTAESDNLEVDSYLSFSHRIKGCYRWVMSHSIALISDDYFKLQKAV